MTKSQVTVRRTPLPSVVEIEVSQPRDCMRSVPLDKLLNLHGVRSLFSCNIDTKRHARLYAKVAYRDGSPIESKLIGSLLDELRAAVMVDLEARAA